MTSPSLDLHESDKEFAEVIAWLDQTDQMIKQDINGYIELLPSQRKRRMRDASTIDAATAKRLRKMEKLRQQQERPT